MRHAKRQEMAQKAATEQREAGKRHHPVLGGLMALLFAGLLGLGGYQAVMHPQTPLPPQWNPVVPLQISHPVTAITNWKLNRAAASGQSCLAALQGAASFQPMEDLEISDRCNVRTRIALRGVGQTSLPSVETRCAIALRLAMWEQHSLQPAAATLLGTRVTGIDHFGSYSCRQLRTPAGPSTRMSTHATADAIDIAGFSFADGRSIRLISDWAGDGPEAQFLRAVRDGACDWFRLTLSPEYNSLHADHFHLQSSGWGLCR